MSKNLLSSLLILTVLNVSGAELTGPWSGKLSVTPQNSLKIVLNISGEAVTMDSPDQSAYGIKCNVIFLSGDSLNITIPQMGVNYAGKVKGDALKGTFKQGPYSFPLTLTPGEKKANRPQTPVPPYPYTTENITVTAPDAVLAGTLTVPADATKATPVVVLVSGSGQQNRDEELFEHKPFAVIADYLARNGIASFRYDDRGYGESTGSLENATTADFALDAEAVVNYLRKSDRFSKIGLIGHSEGGMIAYMLGSKPGLLNFIVSIAGPSVPGTAINAYQNKIVLLNSGVDNRTAEEFSEALHKALLYRLTNGALDSVSEEMLLEMYPQFKSSPIAEKLAETISATLTKKDILPWMDYFLRTDPAVTLKLVGIPAFLIYGEKDFQVPPSLNLAPARENAPDAVIKSYPGLNHMMQHAKTGNIQEYKEIEETIAPEVLSDIVGFILNQKQ